MNFFAGYIAERMGRKKVLIMGWLIGIFVPVIILLADSWFWIIIANVLLGINQGLTWSMTVNMKVDLVHSRQRGIAVGLNEFAGYLGLSIIAFLSGYIASEYGLRPYPIYIGVIVSILGMVLTLFTKDTTSYLEIQLKQQGQQGLKTSLKQVFLKTTWKDQTLSSCSLAGMTTNLKDGMIWGLLAIFLTSHGLSLQETALIVAVYPAAWGFLQLFSGALSDRIGRKWLIVFGMIVQGASIFGFLIFQGFTSWLLVAIILGFGTALVYPTLQAAISDIAHPEWRASSLGVYRFWRDSGYAIGALMSGIITDLLDMDYAIGFIALLPLLAGIIVVFRMKETLHININ
jgi:MFS family permease